jgi:hypothetical protein
VCVAVVLAVGVIEDVLDSVGDDDVLIVGVRLDVRVFEGVFEGDKPSEILAVGDSVIEGVTEIVGVGVREDVGVGVGVFVVDDVGEWEGLAEGTTTAEARPVSLSCIAKPSPGISFTHGTAPHG